MRDSRDVTFPRYVTDPQSQNYACAPSNHWYGKILDADWVSDTCSEQPRKPVGRYEDIVLVRAIAQQRTNALFSLASNLNALPMNRIKDNFERLGIKLEIAKRKHFHGSKNMYLKSIGPRRPEYVAPMIDAEPPRTCVTVRRLLCGTRP